MNIRVEQLNIVISTESHGARYDEGRLRTRQVRDTVAALVHGQAARVAADELVEVEVHLIVAH